MTPDPHAGGAVLHAGAPLEAAKLAVILLHGRGASARDILGLSSAFGLADIAYVAPQAAGHTWYPQSFLAPREENQPYLGSAMGRIEALVRSLAESGFGTERIVIAGFSQGACLSSEFVATHPARYAGLIAFTGGLIGPSGSLAFAPSAKLAGTPALLLSGDPDPHVPWARVEKTAAILSSMGALVTMKRYPGRPHTVSDDEIDLARALLRDVSATSDASAQT